MVTSRKAPWFLTYRATSLRLLAPALLILAGPPGVSGAQGGQVADSACAELGVAAIAGELE